MASASDRFSQSTTWVRRLEKPLREFLRTETGGAALLLTAVVSALVWANTDTSSYEELWRTELSLALGDDGIRLSLREFVNSGLMTFFLDDEDWLNRWAGRYGESGAQALAEELRQLPWRASKA